MDLLTSLGFDRSKQYFGTSTDDAEQGKFSLIDANAPTGSDNTQFETRDGPYGDTANLDTGFLVAGLNPGTLKPAIRQAVEKVAARYGVDPLALSVITLAESSGNPNLDGTFKGLVQISADIIRRYGVTNPFDPEQNLTAGVRNIKDHVLPRMAKAMGVPETRVPTIAVYLGHQQGMIGGPALMAAAMKNDSRPAWKVLQEAVNREIASYGGTGRMSDKSAQAAIRSNIPAEYPGDKSTISAVQFVNAWKNRLGEPAASMPFLKQ